jgi:hypothetical protein
VIRTEVAAGTWRVRAGEVLEVPVTYRNITGRAVRVVLPGAPSVSAFDSSGRIVPPYLETSATFDETPCGPILPPQVPLVSVVIAAGGTVDDSVVWRAGSGYRDPGAGCQWRYEPLAPGVYRVEIGDAWRSAQAQGGTIRVTVDPAGSP